MTQIHLELLPLELKESSLKELFTTQLQKGLSLDQLIPAIEKTLIKINQSVADLTSKQKLSRRVIDPASESEYIRTRRTLTEIHKGLEYLIEARQSVQSPLSKQEKLAMQQLESSLNSLSKQLVPMIKAIVKKRKAENKGLNRILKETIESMKQETLVIARKILLKYEKYDKKKYALALEKLDQLFTDLKQQSKIIVPFIQSQLSKWNTEVLREGRSFYLTDSNLPCAILFSIRGQYYLIFESVGHLLGIGFDKLVMRSMSLPAGKVQALIRPLFVRLPQALSKPGAPAFSKEAQFINMWVETEMLMELKHKRGIINIEERFIIPINGQKNLYFIEDYYWDGTIADYLRYAVDKKIESAKLSKLQQRKIIADLLIGLNEIHNKGIIHHDLKPNNILLDLNKKKGSLAVIADFHLAAYRENKMRLKELPVMAEWCAPEYAKNELLTGFTREEIKQASLAIKTDKLDVWGLGLIFFCIIAYEYPFWSAVQPKENTPEEVDARRLKQISQLQKGWLPSRLKSSPYFSLLKKMLEPDPADRCTAAQALQLFNKTN